MKRERISEDAAALAAKMKENADRLVQSTKPRVQRLVEEAGPAAKRVVNEAGPRATRAGKQALEFARDHEDEIRAVSSLLVRARVTGPLGFVAGAIAGHGRDAGARRDAPCPRCHALTPTPARFCTQCGQALESA